MLLLMVWGLIGLPAAVAAAQVVADGFSGICSIGTGGALDVSLLLADVVVASAVTDGAATWAATDPAWDDGSFRSCLFQPAYRADG